jgi:hypothetical protein
LYLASSRGNTNDKCLDVLKKSSLIQDYNLEQIPINVNNIRNSYKSLLKYFGNDLWKQREDHIKDIKAIVEPSLLSSIIYQRKRKVDDINKLFLSISENVKDKTFVNMMEDIFTNLIIVINYIKKVQPKWWKNSNEDEFFNCLNLFMEELNYIKIYTGKFRKKNTLINHIFMKLKDDIIRIIKERDFNYDEIEIINNFLSLEHINRRRFLFKL